MDLAHTTTYEKEGHMATTTFTTDAGTTAYIDMQGARETAWNYLYGSQRNRLAGDAWFQVYAEADGFGDCRTGAARDGLADYVQGGTDWSHVRDSSPLGLSRVLAKIIELQS